MCEDEITVSSATIINCTITGNAARYDYLPSVYGNGGGICDQTYAGINVIDCIITSNDATSDGGGIYMGSSSKISGCYVNNNWAYWAGGGINYDSWTYQWEFKPSISNCIITDNEAGYHGGGINFEWCTIEDGHVVNCIIELIR